MTELVTTPEIEAKAAKLRLGRRIVSARDSSGLSSRALAERLVNRLQSHLEQGSGQWHRAVVTMQRNLRRYENGHNSPRAELLLAIAEETKTDPQHFASEGDDEETAALRQRARELIAPFQRPDGRRAPGRVPGPRGRTNGRG